MKFLADLDTIDTRWLRAFLAVADTGSFTNAARTVAMTQSGISQHIARLEDALGTELFSRTREGAALTESGESLRGFVEGYLVSVARLREELSGKERPLSGTVRYVMPESCLFANHFAALLKVREKEFPGIRLEVEIVPMDRIHRLVHDGDADFGFVAGKTQDLALDHDLFCREEYVLVGKGGTLDATLKAADVLALPFIDYPGFHETFALWFQMHFPRARTPQLHNLNLVGRVGSLFGVMTMVQSGVGVTVAARQCARPLFHRFGLAVYPAKESTGHQHDIFIVSKAGPAKPRRVTKVIAAFLDLPG